MTTASGASRTFRQGAVDLVPRLRQRAEQAERARTLPKETFLDLRDLGLFRAFVPRAYGGDERALSEVLEAMTEVAMGCPSTAWVGALVAIHNVAVCWLDKIGQEEIFGDGPDVVVASSVAPTGALVPVSGGFRIGGRWGFSSGVDHAAWIMLGATFEKRPLTASAQYFLCFIRASEVLLTDDWHVSGLRATGSKSVEARDVYVPNHRVLLLRNVVEGTAPGLSLHPNPFYRVPWELVFTSAFPPAALGTAISMLEAFRQNAGSRVSRFSGRGFKTNIGSSMRMAEAAAQIDAARLLFRRDIAALDRLALQGGGLHPGTAERILYNVPFVTDVCSRAILRLFRGSGGRALYESNPIQRHFRDIHAMTQHALMDMDSAAETYGQALLLNPAFCVGAGRTNDEED